MTTTEAIKHCLGKEVYNAVKKCSSNPELLKMACLVAFERGYDLGWDASSEKFCAATKLRESLITLSSTGLFTE